MDLPLFQFQVYIEITELMARKFWHDYGYGLFWDVFIMDAFRGYSIDVLNNFILLIKTT